MSRKTKKVKKTVRECTHSPDGYHRSQLKDMNTIPACRYCGRII